MDESGRRTAGFRMDIPEYLADDYKILEDYGYRMKRAHGDRTRKYVKYDDQAFSLILELKLPDSDNWLRIPPKLARELQSCADTEEIERTRPMLLARPSKAATSPASALSLIHI